MTTPTIPATQERYYQRGVTRFYFLPSIAARIPTRPELTDGTDLSDFISDIEGWQLANTPIETPDLGSEFTSSITGEDKADNSSLTLYDDKASEALESLLAKDTVGFIVILRKGDVPTRKTMDVFPVRVGSRSTAYTTSTEPAKFKVSFSITSKPVLDAAVPAAAAG
ncbi:hypothetical protein ACFRCI_03490 [Streptomyces sp. NPDC056638]|uniref:phage tail tube protein n=1 Tax=Streptomyces sp. NPDC056638 TaxID=3345887 RepID=UPI0036B204A4